MPTKHPELERESKIRLFETNGNKAINPPTPRYNEGKTPHCKMCNPVKGRTTVRARERVCTYGIPAAIGLRKHDKYLYA